MFTVVGIAVIMGSFCRDPRLELIHDDARAQLENYAGSFDVIIGDLADPVFGGPCYQLYTDDFYKNVVSKKLNAGGIFVTQSGPCGILTAGEVFSSIHSTLKASFPKVVPYRAHIPAFADTWVRRRVLLCALLLVTWHAVCMQGC